MHVHARVGVFFSMQHPSSLVSKILVVFSVKLCFGKKFIRKVLDSLVENFDNSSFAPWCPACQNLQKTWEDFGEWGKDLGISVAQVDITKSPGLSGRFTVTALPTIYQ